MDQLIIGYYLKIETILSVHRRSSKSILFLKLTEDKLMEFLSYFVDILREMKQYSLIAAETNSFNTIEV